MFFAIIVTILCLDLVNSAQQRVPTLRDISQINDPVLNEVFASSRLPAQPTDEAPPKLERQPPPLMHRGEQQRQSYYGAGEVPISHGDPLGQPVGQQQSSFNQLVDTGANVFASGASAFYQGAMGVGQAFGIQPSNYQVPLLSQAAQLFG